MFAPRRSTTGGGAGSANGGTSLKQDKPKGKAIDPKDFFGGAAGKAGKGGKEGKGKGAAPPPAAAAAAGVEKAGAGGGNQGGGVKNGGAKGGIGSFFGKKGELACWAEGGRGH